MKWRNRILLKYLFTGLIKALIVLFLFFLLGTAFYSLKSDYLKYPVFNIAQCDEPDEEPVTREIVVRVA